MVKVLLESGVSVHLTDQYKSSLLHYSIMAQDDTTALLLLKNGALVNHKDRYGVSSIHLCAVFDKAGIITQALLDQGADVCSAIDDNATVTRLITGISPGFSPLQSAAMVGNTRFIEQLIQNASIDLEHTTSGKTALHIAVCCNQPAVLKKLLPYSELELVDSCNGNTLLHYAAFNQSLECLDLLLFYGANCHSKNHMQYTPLHIAMQLRSLSPKESSIQSIIDRLILFGSDIFNRVDCDFANMAMLPLQDYTPYQLGLILLRIDSNTLSMYYSGETLSALITQQVALNLAYTSFSKAYSSYSGKLDPHVAISTSSIFCSDQSTLTESLLGFVATDTAKQALELSECIFMHTTEAYQQAVIDAFIYDQRQYKLIKALPSDTCEAEVQLCVIL